MKIQSLFSLQWKSFIRDPLFEPAILFRLLTGVYLLMFVFFLYFLGFFIEPVAEWLFPNETNPLKIFLFAATPLLLFDFALKFILKKNNNSQYINLLRFPNSKRNISVYIVLKEMLSFWNFYLLIFFVSYLTTIIYPDYGLWMTVVLFFLLWMSQIMISQLISKIKQYRIEPLYISVFSTSLLPENNLFNYLLLSVQMMIRSPRLRQQIFRYLIIMIVYFYLFATKQILLQVFPVKLIFMSLLLLLFSNVCNQFLFAAEAAFFDRLMTVPNFKKILPAKYILYVFLSVIPFLILLIILPFSWKSFIELIAIFLYCTGTVTLLSFSCILFVTTKIDLFGSQRKLMNNPPSVQALAILLVNVLTIGIAIAISWLFSNQVAIYYMLVAGIFSILCANTWFNYLYRCFYPNKYEKMELFRIQ